MVTRERVLVEMVVNGGMRLRTVAIYKVLPEVWRVNHWGISCKDFAEDDLIAAVDAFIGCLPNPNDEFPDADDIRSYNERTKDTDYLQWCEDNEEPLAMIAKSIVQANCAGKRTIVFEIPGCEPAMFYSRFFKEKHYDVEITPRNGTGESGSTCTLSWSRRNRGPRH